MTEFHFRSGIAVLTLALLLALPASRSDARSPADGFRGEMSCEVLKDTGRAGWQGRFSGQAGSMGSSFSMTPYAEANEWRCFRSRKDCTDWLTMMNWEYGARIYLSACVEYR